MFLGGQVHVPVVDLQRALRFYIESLGMKLVGDAAAAPVLDAGEGLLLCLSTAPASIRAEPIATLRVKGDFDVSLTVLENRGIKLTRDAGGPLLSDSEGNTFALVSA